MSQLTQSTESIDLISATSIGDYNTVEDILKNNLEDVNNVNASGWTPVMYAANYGHFNIIRLMVRYNCDVNHRDWQGRTALMLAASNGHTRCLDVLINYGNADKSLKDMSGNNAFKYAKNCGHGNNKLIKTLLLKTDGYELKGRAFMAPTPAPSPVSLTKSSEISESETLIGEIYNPYETTAFSNSTFSGFLSSLNSSNASRNSISSNRYNASQSSATDSSVLSSSQSSAHSLLTSAQKIRRRSVNSRKKSIEPFSSPLPKTLFHLLTRIELIQYLDLFENNGIDFNQFLTLTDTDFQNLGITSYGHRKKLTIAQSRYHESLDINNTQESFFADYLLNERDLLNGKIKELEEKLNEMLNSKN